MYCNVSTKLNFTVIATYEKTTRTYEYVRVSNSWFQAKDACFTTKRKLAVVKNEEDLEALAENVPKVRVNLICCILV